MRPPSNRAYPPSPNGLPDSPTGSDDDLSDVVNTIVGHQRGDAEVARIVRNLAIGFLEGWRRQVKSPKPTEAVALLEAVARTAADLANTMSALPEFLRILIQDRYALAARWDPMNHALVRLNLPVPTEESLSVLAKVARDQIAFWRVPTSEQIVPLSKSGKKRAFERLFGDVRLFYACRVADLIIETRSRKIEKHISKTLSGREGG